MDPNDLIYDWNRLPGSFAYAGVNVELDDETLRDGLQNPTVKDPPIGRKIEMLHLIAEMGIQAADIGLPGAGPRAREAVMALATEIAGSTKRAASKPAQTPSVAASKPPAWSICITMEVPDRCIPVMAIG